MSELNKFPSEEILIEKSEKKILDKLYYAKYKKFRNHLIDLNLQGYNLKHLPENFENLKFLKVLNLSFNPLISLPESFGNLKSLKALYLFGTNLKSLPESFGNLKSLEILDLHDSNLNALPDSFRNLKTLKILDLSNTKLNYLPNSLGNLLSLEKLGLNGLNLKILPDSFKNLKKLKVLNLYKNKLTDIPKYIENFENLEELVLNRNPIKSLSYIPLNLLRSTYITPSHLSPKGRSLYERHKFEDLYKYYYKPIVKLISDYISNQNSLNDEEKDRLVFEIKKNEIKVLETSLKLDDPILKRILNNFSFTLSNGLKIFL